MFNFLFNYKPSVFVSIYTYFLIRLLLQRPVLIISQDKYSLLSYQLQLFFSTFWSIIVLLGSWSLYHSIFELFSTKGFLYLIGTYNRTTTFMSFLRAVELKVFSIENKGGSQFKQKERNAIKLIVELNAILKITL